MDILSFFSRRCVVAGTFRPDRIRSIADRFGVNGDMALENILYGMPASVSSLTHGLTTKLARAFNSEHQVGAHLRHSLSGALRLNHPSPQMELINECSQRFAEDKDFRLIVRTMTIRTYTRHRCVERLLTV